MGKLVWLSQQETCNCIILTMVIWGILYRGYSRVAFRWASIIGIWPTFGQLTERWPDSVTILKASSMLKWLSFSMATSRL